MASGRTGPAPLPAGDLVPASPLLPGLLLGVGLGGFVDGIVLHQILQWHHMISDEESPGTVLGLERNTLFDGLFHAASWVAVVAGVAVLSRRQTAPGHGAAPRRLWGWVLFGWGLFNVIEGVVDHHLLGLHHVRDDVGAPIGWDIGFLALGAVLMALGWLLQRQGPNSSDPSAGQASATRSA